MTKSPAATKGTRTATIQAQPGHRYEVIVRVALGDGRTRQLYTEKTRTDQDAVNVLTRWDVPATNAAILKGTLR